MIAMVTTIPGLVMSTSDGALRPGTNMPMKFGDRSVQCSAAKQKPTKRR